MSAINLYEKLEKEAKAIVRKGDKKKLKEFFQKFESFDHLVAKCILWGHIFIPEYFSEPSPDFHFGIVKKFFSNVNEYTAYPRGFGKTTMIQACICFSVVNHLDKFILVIEKSFNEASEVLESIRNEFRDNDTIVEVYGQLTKVSPRGVRDDRIKDAEGDFFINGIRLRAKGFDAPVRGIKSRYTRPTRIILDDIESDEHIENDEQRKKYLRNYLRGVIPAVAPSGGNLKVFGTILHDDSLLNTLIKNHDGEIFRAWNKDRKLLWVNYWTVERLEEKRKEMAIEGRGDAAFHQEYFNEPVPEDDQEFRKSMFRYFNDYQLKHKIMKNPYKAFIALDPAISKKNRADFTALVAVLVNQLNEFYIVEIIRERFNPIETIKALIAMYERWKPEKVGIETVSYQKSLVYFIDEIRKKKSSLWDINIHELKVDLDKERKIRSLQPRYAIGNVYHRENSETTRLLEEELLRFPRGATDDVIDALASVMQMAVPPRKPVDSGYRGFKERRRKIHRQVAY
jgi:predicted phage terminase large subunit-like protein